MAFKIRWNIFWQIMTLITFDRECTNLVDRKNSIYFCCAHSECNSIYDCTGVQRNKQRFQFQFQAGPDSF